MHAGPSVVSSAPPMPSARTLCVLEYCLCTSAHVMCPREQRALSRTGESLVHEERVFLVAVPEGSRNPRTALPRVTRGEVAHPSPKIKQSNCGRTPRSLVLPCSTEINFTAVSVLSVWLLAAASVAKMQISPPPPIKRGLFVLSVQSILFQDEKPLQNYRCQHLYKAFWRLTTRSESMIY